MSVIHEQLGEALEVVHEAETAIMGFYDAGTLESRRKADGTFVTQADMAAHIILTRGLGELFDVPLLSEEGDEDENREIATSDHFITIDPVDNTNGLRTYRGQFMAGVSEVIDGVPAYGIACAPVERQTYYGGPGHGSFRQVGRCGVQEIKTASEQSTGVVMVSHNQSPFTDTGEYIEANYPDCRWERAGSYLKYVRVAEGRADLYPRADTGMLIWDGAPGHAIVTGAGGNVTHLDGSEIDYRGSDLLIGDFAAWSGALPLKQPDDTGEFVI